MNIKKVFGKIIDANKSVLRGIVRSKKVFQNSNINYETLFEDVHRNAEPCFVLSTGRCGTHLMTKLFNRHSEFDVYHEPNPELIYFSKFAYDYHDSKSEELKLMFDAARYELIRNSFLLNQQFLETNNRITFFAYQISKLYPKAKFIHLVRNPYEFVKSGMSRKWYTGENAHDEGRIKMEGDQWNNMQRTQKIAWLWNETNLFVEKFKSNIDSKRVVTIKSEELFSDADIAISLFNFLNRNPLEKEQIKKIISKPTNVGKKEDINRQEFYKDVNPYIDLANKYNYTLENH